MSERKSRKIAIILAIIFLLLYPVRIIIDLIFARHGFRFSDTYYDYCFTLNVIFFILSVGFYLNYKIPEWPSIYFFVYILLGAFLIIMEYGLSGFGLAPLFG